jgi:hypothetical protein
MELNPKHEARDWKFEIRNEFPKLQFSNACVGTLASVAHDLVGAVFFSGEFPSRGGFPYVEAFEFGVCFVFRISDFVLERP